MRESAFSDEELIELQGSLGYLGSRGGEDFNSELQKAASSSEYSYDIIGYYTYGDSNIQYTLIQDKTTKEVCLIFEGSRGGIDSFSEDWLDNIRNASYQDVLQYQEVESLLTQLKKEYGSRLSAVTGNSLGGGLAIIAAKYLADDVRIIPVNPSPPDFKHGKIEHPNMTVVVGSTDPLSQLVMVDLLRLPEKFQRDYLKLEKQLRKNQLSVTEFNDEVEKLRIAHGISQKDIYGSEVMIVERSLDYHSTYGIELAHVGSLYSTEQLIKKWVSFDENDDKRKYFKEVVNDSMEFLTVYQEVRFKELLAIYLNSLENKKSRQLSASERKELFGYFYYGLDTLAQREIDQAKLADSLAGFMAFDLLNGSLINISDGKHYGNKQHSFKINSEEELETIIVNLNKEIEDYRRNIIDYSFGNVILALDQKHALFSQDKIKVVEKVLDNIITGINVLRLIENIIIPSHILRSVPLVGNLINQIQGLSRELSKILNETIEHYVYDHKTLQVDGVRRTLREFQHYFKQYIEGICCNMNLLGTNIRNSYQYLNSADMLIAGNSTNTSELVINEYTNFNRQEVHYKNYTVVYNASTINMIERYIMDKLEEFRVNNLKLFTSLEDRIYSLIDKCVVLLRIYAESLVVASIPISGNSPLPSLSSVSSERIIINDSLFDKARQKRDEISELIRVLKNVRNNLNLTYCLDSTIRGFKDELVGLLLDDSLISTVLYNYRQACEVSTQMKGVLRNLEQYMFANTRGGIQVVFEEGIKQQLKDLKFIKNQLQLMIGERTIISNSHIDEIE